MAESKTFYFAAAICVLLALLIILTLTRTDQKRRLILNIDQQREYANELVNKELFVQAVVEYDRYVEDASLTPEAMANIDYIVGNIYMDRLRDYENAMARYLRVKHIAPRSKLIGEVNRRIVECLERLDRSLDAQQEMRRATALNEDGEDGASEGMIVAEIEGRKITAEEVENALERLPQNMRSEFEGQEGRVSFLKQFVVTELLYDTAKRKGYDRNKEIVEQVFQIKKGLMVQKLLGEEIEEGLAIDEDDVKLYYEAHKEEYVDKTGDHVRQLGFEEARGQATDDLIRERQRKAYERLIERMLAAEEVKIYEDRVQ